MRFSGNEIDPARRRLGDTVNYAPPPVIGAMIALMDPESVVASIAESSAEGERITWRALWFDGKYLAYVDASRAARSWNLSHHDDDTQADDIEAWSRPLGRLEALAVTGLRITNRMGEWRNEVIYELRFSDARVSVPLFGELPDYGRERDYDKFLTAIREAH